MHYGEVAGVEKRVSRLVQGTMMLNSEDLDTSLALLDAVFDQGCTAFDTAHVYGGGDCERVLGHRGGPARYSGTPAHGLCRPVSAPPRRPGGRTRPGRRSAQRTPGGRAYPGVRRVKLVPRAYRRSQRLRGRPRPDWIRGEQPEFQPHRHGRTHLARVRRHRWTQGRSSPRVVHRE